MRRGILLGSFDPIHIGHISMATAALNENLVDEVIFVPAYQNPWKTRSTDFDIRVMMTQLAVDDLENCKVSIVDYFNIEPYYTSNTLKLLNGQKLKVQENNGLYCLKQHNEVVALVKVEDFVAKMSIFLG
jgi:nicotinate-nucleotide adenylyltransferase